MAAPPALQGLLNPPANGVLEQGTHEIASSLPPPSAETLLAMTWGTIRSGHSRGHCERSEAISASLLRQPLDCSGFFIMACSAGEEESNTTWQKRSTPQTISLHLTFRR